MNARIAPSLLNATQALNQVSQAWDTDLVAQLSPTTSRFRPNPPCLMPTGPSMA